MTKAALRLSAVTAKLLGYQCIRARSGDLELMEVHGPATPMKDLEGPYISTYKAIVHWYYRDTVSGTNLPTEIEALSCYQIRLHMEANYGVKTPHYWEK